MGRKGLEEATPESEGMDSQKLQTAAAYAQRSEGSGLILRRGRVVMGWGDRDARYDLKSSTKSIGVTALGLLLDDGVVKLEDRAIDHHSGFGVPPESNADTGWLEEITLRHLATQTAGFEKPGGYERLMFEPGTAWAYSDGGPNWLAECLTLACGRDLNELMFERVFGPIGISTDDLFWRRNNYREEKLNRIKRREFGAGIHANVKAMARIGLLYLASGEWEGASLLTKPFVERATRTDPATAGLPVDNDVDGRFGGASNHYGLLWWNNADGTLQDAPCDTYWSYGLHDSFILVVPDLEVVLVRAGRGWEGSRKGSCYEALRPLVGPIVESITRGTH